MILTNNTLFSTLKAIMDDFLRLDVKERRLYFKDSSCAQVQRCQALCCRKWDINLAFEEAREGIYRSEAFCVLDKALCSHPKKPCPHRSYRLKKKKDGTCIYLNKEFRCAIHATRPLVCQNYFCDTGFDLVPICVAHQDLESDAEICSFEGGLQLKTKYMMNPYLHLSRFLSSNNSNTLIFRDSASCKEKKVTLIAMNVFKNKIELKRFLGHFNGKKALAAILKKTSLSRTDFQNIVLYLIDEHVLTGVY